jgi:hypothetical protein
VRAVWVVKRQVTGGVRLIAPRLQGEEHLGGRSRLSKR